MDSHPLLADVLAFVETHGLKESTFGRLAVNDWAFIRDLRGDNGRPRRIWPETEQKVRRFMATYRPDAPAPRGEKPAPSDEPAAPQEAA